jgi:hypothetical protein
MAPISLVFIKVFNSKLARYGLTFSLLLILNFLIQAKWIVIRTNIVASNLTLMLIISFVLLGFFSEQAKIKPHGYLLLIGYASLLALIGASVNVIFLELYSKFFDPAYFARALADQISKMRMNGYDEIAINNSISTMVAGRKYFLPEISLAGGIIIRTISMAMILGYFFENKQPSKITSN